jgi:hypothetical protein
MFSESKLAFLYSTGSQLTTSMAYYWGLVGILMPLTIYRPAYSAAALRGSILNSQSWLLFWTFFIVVSRLSRIPCPAVDKADLRGSQFLLSLPPFDPSGAGRPTEEIPHWSRFRNGRMRQLLV